MFPSGLPFCKGLADQGAAMACELLGPIAIIYGPWVLYGLVIIGAIIYATLTTR